MSDGDIQTDVIVGENSNLPSSLNISDSMSIKPEISNQITSLETVAAVNDNGMIVNESCVNNSLNPTTTCEEKTHQSCIVKELQRTRFKFWNPFSWMSGNENAIEDIEYNMFKCLKTPVERFYVNIRNNSLKIWTLSANTKSNKTPIVLVHGFCGGIGLWVHNIDALSEARPFYAFDLLGFGRSSRPPFSSDPIVAETQFVESIEDWRKEMGLNEIILMGHSFGGYLSASYALRYPQYVKALILADPWGFPEHSNENKPDTPMPLWISMIAVLSQYVSPLSVFRVTGQVGVTLFKTLRPDFKYKYMSILDNPDLVYSYLYFANNSYPRYFGFAKNPMIKRIDKIKTHIPIWFIYGSRSWIDCTSGFSAVYIRQRFAQVAPISVEIISGAGHHVYADKPNEFNEYMKFIFEEIDTTDEQTYQEPTSNNSNSITNSDYNKDYSNPVMNCN